MFKRLNEKKEKGFTLIELLIVMALLGVLVAVMLPKYQDLTPEAKLVASQQNMQTIQSAVLIYAAKNLSPPLPDSLEALVTYFPRRKVPVEKISGLNTSQTQNNADDTAITSDNSGGWIYNKATGTVWVNVTNVTTFISNYTGSVNPFADW
jgi:prepilin-type N-terminal cleavage/methylation domain-containing protein